MNSYPLQYSIAVSYTHLDVYKRQVLDWLNMPTFKLKTFIANQVAAITEWTNTESWRHVHGVSNPADLASRCV